MSLSVVCSGGNSYPPIGVDSDVTPLIPKGQTAASKSTRGFEQFIEGIGIKYFIEWLQILRIGFGSLRNGLNHTKRNGVVTFTYELRSGRFRISIGADAALSP